VSHAQVRAIEERLERIERAFWLLARALVRERIVLEEIERTISGSAERALSGGKVKVLAP
jgi:hypothetical protein